MRIVLDTNILVRAAASPGGPAGELFERIAADHVMVTSVELLSELARVMAYDRVRQLHRLSDAKIGEFIQSIASGAVVIRLSEEPPRVVTNDPDDDRLLATAAVGHADILCTLDRHLFHKDVVAHCQSHAIAIMNDVVLLEKLRNG
jgi:putative PIN family toxin of toxin-antitoxin system